MCGGTGGPCRKVWTPTKKIKPEHTLFCRKLIFVAIYALFGDLWAKKVPFGVKNIVSWARMHYYKGYIAHYSVNLQICNYAQKMTHLSRRSQIWESAANFCRTVLDYEILKQQNHTMKSNKFIRQISYFWSGKFPIFGRAKSNPVHLVFISC